MTRQERDAMKPGTWMVDPYSGELHKVVENYTRLVRYDAPDGIDDAEVKHIMRVFSPLTGKGPVLWMPSRSLRMKVLGNA